MSGEKRFHGPYRAEFGAIHHEDEPGFLFTVEPARVADMVADALNKAAVAPELLRCLKDAVADLETTLGWREGWECSDDELLGTYRAAIARAGDDQ